MEIGPILSSQYGLVKCILECLPASELVGNANHVCKLWRDVCRVVLRSRGRRESFYFEGEKALPQKKILERVKSEFLEEFTHFVRNKIHSVPDVCFVLTSGDERQFHEINGSDLYPYDDYKLLYNTFLESKSLWVSSFYGIVSPSVEIETRRFVRPSFTFLSFPSFPNAKVHTFDLTTNSSESVVIKDLVPNLQEDEVVKGLIAFSSDDILNPTLARLITNCAERSNGNMACAGALISLTWQCSLEDKRPDAQMAKSNVSGLIFSGDGMNVRSIILSSDVASPKDVERELSKLKPEEYTAGVVSYAFMFACCGRGKAHYRGESDVESSTFRRLFPHTHLVGCFCGGEIGLNSYPGCIKTKNPSIDDVFHSYTSVFMLISINNQDNL